MVQKPLTTNLTLEISKLRTDGGTQPRAALSDAAVQEYADAMIAGDIFPAVDVFYDGANYWLVDGFHRIEAAKLARRKTFLTKVHQGQHRDAILFSCGANAKHGLRRTPADSRRAVERILNDAEWSGWSNRKIAEHCQVSESFVRNIRSELSAFRAQIEVDRAGSNYTQKTAHADYVSGHAPAPIKKKWESGEISTKQAYEVTTTLERVSEPVRALAFKHGVVNAEVLNIVNGREKSETFNVILTTGFLQGSGEPIHIAKASVGDVERVFEEAHNEHKRGNGGDSLLNTISPKAWLDEQQRIVCFKVDDWASAEAFFEYVKERKPKMKLLVYEQGA